MRIWFDTEFIEDGRTIDLLSIGMIREDGMVYYAEPAETDRSRASAWVQENVFPSMKGPVKPRAQIADELVHFCGHQPEFWAYYAASDWVALYQLFGTLMERPESWPMHVMDFKQWMVDHGLTSEMLGPRIEADGTAHNALDDAIWLQRVSQPYLPHRF